MRKFLILAAILLLAAALLLPILDGGSPQTEKTTGKISAAEGKALLEDTPGMMLVDVRRADEYEAGHIPGAILIPNESIGEMCIRDSPTSPPSSSSATPASSAGNTAWPPPGSASATPSSAASWPCLLYTSRCV